MASKLFSNSGSLVIPAGVGQKLHPRALWTTLTAARWLWLPLVVFSVTRLGIMLTAYLGMILLPNSVEPPVYHLRPPDNLVVDALTSRWDTGFYVSIVEEGYINEGVPLPSVAFFPLLPLAMTAARPLVGGDAVYAGLLVANLALLLATILFYRLVAEEWGEPVADRAVWYLLIFPAAFFGSAIYSESLFLLCAIGALYFARRGRWGIVALLAVAATLSRLVGIIVLPMLLLEWAQQRHVRQGTARPGYRALLAPLLAPLGTLGYMAYLGRTFGDPLAFAHASAAWGRVPQSPAGTIAQLLERPAGGWLAALSAGQLHVNDWFDLLMVIFFLVMGFVLLYQHRWSEGIFVWSGVMLAFSSGLLMSQRRYVWVLFPVFILLARWGDRLWVDRLVTTLSLMGLALFTALFANGYWVG